MAEWSNSDREVDDSALCARFLKELPIDGVSVCVFGGTAPEEVLCATDSLAARLDELQFDLGEGPRWQAAHARNPVLEPRVREVEHPLWPIFHAALMDTPVAALYVFPLNLGALNVGCVELYSTSKSTLDRADRAKAAVLANETTWKLLDRLLQGTETDMRDSALTAVSALSRREIHQATGMVLVQMDVTPTEALLLLRAHAFSQGRTVRSLAGDVVARRLIFDSESD